MTTILLMLGALVVVFVVAALATRESAAMAPTEADRPDVVLRAGARGEDVRAVRFPLAVRGYRMRDVDAVLERLAAELDARDARLAALEGRDEAPAADDATADDAAVGHEPSAARLPASQAQQETAPVAPGMADHAASHTPPAAPVTLEKGTRDGGSAAVRPLPSDVR